MLMLILMFILNLFIHPCVHALKLLRKFDRFKVFVVEPAHRNWIVLVKTSFGTLSPSHCMQLVMYLYWFTIPQKLSEKESLEKFESDQKIPWLITSYQTNVIGSPGPMISSTQGSMGIIFKKIQMS